MKRTPDKAVLLLGSNSGDCLETINKAKGLIETLAGKIILKSFIFKTAPWGFTEQPYFLNQVIVIENFLNPSQLLQVSKSIEKTLGRTISEKWKQRIIDIDILFMENLILETEDLIIPHPQLHLRKFTLIPLQEILPDFVHPKLNQTINELLQTCLDNGEVIKLYPTLSEI